MIPLAEAAKRFGCSVQTIRNWIFAGKITYSKIGGRYYISEKTIEETMKPLQYEQKCRSKAVS